MPIRLLICTILFSIMTTLWSCQNNAYPQGKRYYNAYCANCHMDDGRGLNELIPSLVSSDYLRNHQDQLPCIIRYGIESKIDKSAEVFNLQMPAHQKLSEIDILNIINYINNSWGNEIDQSNLQSVRSRLKKCSH